MNLLPNTDRVSIEKHNISKFSQAKQNKMITWIEYCEESIPQYKCSINKAKEEISTFFEVKEVISIGSENIPE